MRSRSSEVERSGIPQFRIGEKWGCVGQKWGSAGRERERARERERDSERERESNARRGEGRGEGRGEERRGEKSRADSNNPNITLYGQALYPYWHSRKGTPFPKLKNNFAYAFVNKK